MTVAVLIVAAGRGSRAAQGTGGVAKQYALLGRRPLLSHTLAAFAAHPQVDHIAIVIHPDDRETYAQAVVNGPANLAAAVMGGATRQQSVRLGLQALSGLAPAHVLIHDAARPFVDHDVISRVIAQLGQTAGAIAATPVTDTLKKASADGLITATIDRALLWRAQTPQGFLFNEILAAHERAAVEGFATFTDDAAIAEWAGMIVALVDGSEANTKITTAEDLHMAERRLNLAPIAFETRTGTGFDVHRFCAGDHVWLCGVKLPHTHKLDGHSDADVGLHALTDALLGAIGDGDIGQHFPPSDPQWKGAASHLFLADAARRIQALGGFIVNVDVTLLCEEPRVGPHRDAMQHAISQVLGIAAQRVGIKATTTEGLGFTGRREGIAAMASATVRLPI